MRHTGRILSIVLRIFRSFLEFFSDFAGGQGFRNHLAFVDRLHFVLGFFSILWRSIRRYISANFLNVAADGLSTEGHTLRNIRYDFQCLPQLLYIFCFLSEIVLFAAIMSRIFFCWKSGTQATATHSSDPANTVASESRTPALRPFPVFPVLILGSIWLLKNPRTSGALMSGWRLASTWAKLEPARFREKGEFCRSAKRCALANVISMNTSRAMISLSSSDMVKWWERLSMSLWYETVEKSDRRASIMIPIRLKRASRNDSRKRKSRDREKGINE